MRLAAFSLACCLATSSFGIEVGSRLKVFTSVANLSSTDFLTNTVGDTLSDHHLDLRLLIRHKSDAWRFNLDPTLTVTAGDALQLLTGSGLTLDQLPGTDANRLFNWSNELFAHSQHRGVARIDRASVSYRQPSWSLQLGRQAVSWGNGLVFQPLDLFSPFAPTTVDREFKPGVDALLFESLLGNAGEFQALWIGRQKTTGQSPSHTAAVKWAGGVSQLGIELILAQHFSDDFGAVSLSIPVGGAMVRIEGANLCGDGACTTTGLINLDYTVSVGPGLFYVFAELYHNGYGEDGVVTPISAELQERLTRGEVFTLMENYGSIGANITWHPLWSQTFVVIRNLQDQSGLYQTFLNYDPSDASRMQFGVSVPFGDDNTEFGVRRFEEPIEGTSGGNPSLYASISYYF